VPARDEIFQVTPDEPLAPQVELDPAADRELDLGLLLAERDPVMTGKRPRHIVRSAESR
jgi:hypothetical protein